MSIDINIYKAKNLPTPEKLVQQSIKQQSTPVELKKTKCTFGLRKYCPFGFTAIDLLRDSNLVKIYCATCIKSKYAKAKFRMKYAVVNTL